MPTIRLKYDGWLALPAAARQKLGLTTDAELEVEVTNGAIVLRPIRTTRAADHSPAVPALEVVRPEPAAAEPIAAPPTVVKRGPGRPRKAPVAALPPALKTRGRRKAAPDGGLSR